jgi:drug/metabolite transporter (DMT)-like permease
VLAHYVLKEQINSIKTLCIVLSLAGTVLVSGAADPSAWQVNAAGILFGLLTGFFFACYNMLGKTSANRAIDPWTTMLYSFGGAVIFLFLFNIAKNSFSGQLPLSNFLWLSKAWIGWVVLILLGIGPTIGGFGLYLVSLGYLPATVVNLIAVLEPVFTAIWAYFFFHEQLTMIQAAGSVLVIASVIFLRLGEGCRQDSTT